MGRARRAQEGGGAAAVTRRAAGRDGRAPAGGRGERSGPWAGAVSPEGPATAGIQGRGWGRPGLRPIARPPPPVPGEGARPQLEVSRGGWAKSTAGDRDAGEQREVEIMGPLACSLGARWWGRMGACTGTGVRVRCAGLSGPGPGNTKWSHCCLSPWEGRCGGCIEQCRGPARMLGTGK